MQQRLAERLEPVLGVLNNGMSLIGIGSDVQQVIKGLVLLAAVGFDVYDKQKCGA